MDATLKYSLPEEREDLEMALHGASFAVLLSDLDNKARSALKHGHNHNSADSVFEWLRQYLREEAPSAFDW